MNVDTTQNVVIFLFRQPDGEEVPLTTAVPTLADDGLSQAWAQLRKEFGELPAPVVRVHSEWEGTEADGTFAAEHFPEAQLTYNFGRPDTPAGWVEAMREATETMQEVHRQKSGEEAEPERELLPILRTSAEYGIGGLLPKIEVVPDALYVTFARAGMTPHGTIGMSHLTHHQYTELGSPELTDLLAEAMGNLADGLSFQVAGSDERQGKIVEMRRERHFAGSALALPGMLSSQVGRQTGDERLIAGLACADHLFLTGADSEWVDDIKEATRGHGHQTEFVQPSIFLIEGSQIELVERY